MSKDNFLKEDRGKKTLLSPVVRVIGVGGIGVKIAGSLYEQNIPAVDIVVCDTDAKELDKSPDPQKLLMGAELNQGHGTGGDVALGQKCAEISEEAIKTMLIGSPDIVMILTGMGKGTGTGASPIISCIAKEAGLITLGLIVLPEWFVYEEEDITEDNIFQAFDRAQEMKRYTDGSWVIRSYCLNDRSKNIEFLNPLELLTEVLSNAIKSLSDLVSFESSISIADVKVILKDCG